ncbi:Thioredoxin M2, chloroplastic [Gracilariopsis chorda]|uniref:Thioredoxin M2, chloroplastic n=1 Tax=Gracilariopsis chorda TaxID=448386 RepID=A0A2V3IWW0_9FLOR|nr:Thioredoxin M2, chloroplastic [Gracilariopsis chorda]|eukprot:PXF46601.1 Thioredoxin M2, chloroplastic [Gracilariopsis chorda]
MKPSNAIASFGEYFAVYFANRYPQISAKIRPDRTTFAANVFLFRFDSRLSVQFVRNHIDSFSRSIADASGKSIPEARRLFTVSVHDAARAYFASGWKDVSPYLHSNASSLTHLRLQNTKLDELQQALNTSSQLPQVDLILLQSLFENNMPVLLFVYADYCSVCKAVRPVFEDMARTLTSSAICVSLNGPKCPEFKHQYRILSYPAIIRFDNYGNGMQFPKQRRDMNLQNLIAFANGDRFLNELPSSPGVIEDELEFTSPRRVRSQWQSMLRRQGIDQLDALVSERSEVLHSKIDAAIHCGQNSCDVIPMHSRNGSGAGASPLCVLLGGGMGAGKTTVVNMISETKFWKQHGASVVVVEADAFKLSDPLFQVLQSVTPLASRIVHKDSLEAAEQLFLQAVNTRRDVVFDGTLSWCEYARQTVAMLRDTDYFYERGPGYVEKENGEVSEIYWVRAGRRPAPVAPYRVELVGVTTDPEIAVMRGIIRKMTTGRGVPVPNQLKSHALFSQHFETYIDLMDSAYLFDTTLHSDHEASASSTEQLVAIKSGMLFKNPSTSIFSSRGVRGFVVRHADAYERFLKKKFLNTEARSSDELYQNNVSVSRKDRRK